MNVKLNQQLKLKLVFICINCNYQRLTSVWIIFESFKCTQCHCNTFYQLQFHSWKNIEIMFIVLNWTINCTKMFSFLTKCTNMSKMPVKLFSNEIQFHVIFQKFPVYISSIMLLIETKHDHLEKCAFNEMVLKTKIMVALICGKALKPSNLLD